MSGSKRFPVFHIFRPLLCAAAFFFCTSSALAVTYRVGPDAGRPGSACEFHTPQEAIDALPDTDELHVIELEAANYSGGDATIDIDGRAVHIVTRYNHGGCSAPTTAHAVLNANQTALPGGRTVVVRNDAELILESVAMFGNQSGGVLVRDSSLVLRASIVDNHRTPAGSSGAALVLEGGSVKVEDSRLNGNVAGANGGAVFCAGSDSQSAIVHVTGGSTITRNRARHGGAIYLFHGCTLTLDDETLLADNTSELDGGAIGIDPGGDDARDHGLVVLAGAARFLDNAAGRDGGAIHLTAGNDLEARPGSRSLFVGNRAAGRGGALRIAAAGAHAEIGAAQFIDNQAGEHGGAVAVSGGVVSLHADCANDDTIAEDYCALFERNAVANEGNEIRSGGSLHLDGDGELWIDAYAFRDSRGPAMVTGGSGGVIAAVDSGLLRLGNSLVFDTREGLGDFTHLFQINDGIGQFFFNTMVDTPAGSVILVQREGKAELVGNIIAANHAGVIGDGDISGTCNNVQLGTEPAPRDPGFVTTPAGRYRLGPDSLMIDRGLSCDADDLPPDFVSPEYDLDGRVRVRTGEPAMAIDAGAFEFRPTDGRIFGDGFETASPE